MYADGWGPEIGFIHITCDSVTNSKVWACAGLVRILAKVLFQPGTEPGDSKSDNGKDGWVLAASLHLEGEQWIQCKLGKQYLWKKVTLSWELNPGPTPIRGDMATVIVSVKSCSDQCHHLRTLIWSHLSLESPPHSAQHRGFGLCCQISSWTHFRTCKNE